MSCRTPTFALILLVAVVAGQHQFSSQYFQPRPFAALPHYYSSGENNLAGPSQNPVSTQNINYNHNYLGTTPNHYFNNQQNQQRFLFGGFITSYLTSTVTTTSTSTATTTCTVSTTACSGRRRRSLSVALLGEEATDEIQPTSIVEGISEIMAANEEKSSRKARAAQGFHNNHYYFSQPASMLQYFGPNDFVYPSSVDPALIGTYQRTFFYHIFTSTTTTSTTTTTTVRFNPICSIDSSYNQC